jgi:quinol monooxygenase YgiN
MKKLIFGIAGFLLLVFFASSSPMDLPDETCSYSKDSMQVVMRFELKVKPEYVALLKHSWDACRAEVLANEPGCLDYSLFQSYNDSTLFCITEAWATKADHNAHMELAHTQKHLKETRGIHDPSFASATNYVYWVCPGANESD